MWRWCAPRCVFTLGIATEPDDVPSRSRAFVSRSGVALATPRFEDVWTGTFRSQPSGLKPAWYLMRAHSRYRCIQVPTPRDALVWVPKPLLTRDYQICEFCRLTVHDDFGFPHVHDCLLRYMRRCVDGSDHPLRCPKFLA